MPPGRSSRSCCGPDGCARPVPGRSGRPSRRRVRRRRGWSVRGGRRPAAPGVDGGRARSRRGRRLGPRAVPAGPAEEAAAAAMPPRRRREFLAGRLAARRALGAVGLDCGEIPRSGRLPLFPPGRRRRSRTARVSRWPWPGRRATTSRSAATWNCAPALRGGAAGAAPGRGGAAAHSRPGTVSWSVTSLFSAKEAAWKALHTGPRALPDGALRSLRDLRARPAAPPPRGS
ncbi:enterobactin synthetase [Streptomyces sp. M10(2022)]